MILKRKFRRVALICLRKSKSNFAVKINIVFIVLTLSSIFFGVKFGFIDSHTPPLPFVISGILLIVGTILIFLKNIFKDKYSYQIHIAFTVLNLLIVLYCLLLPF